VLCVVCVARYNNELTRTRGGCDVLPFFLSHSLFRFLHSTMQSKTYECNNRIFHNWACINYFKPRYFHRPTTQEEIVEILNYARSHGEKVKVIGSCHTPNSVCVCIWILRRCFFFVMCDLFVKWTLDAVQLICTEDHLISLENYCNVLEIDTNKCLVKVYCSIQATKCSLTFSHSLTHSLEEKKSPNQFELLFHINTFFLAIFSNGWYDLNRFKLVFVTANWMNG
jgi:hypothetical protein